jgi:hypothetical protein
MRYYILFFLLIIVALAACKKDNTIQTPLNHIVAHDTISSRIAGVYIGTWICCSGTPPNSSVCDTGNTSWTVILIDNTDISVNGNQMSLSEIQQTSYTFQGVSQNYISGGYACELYATFDSSFHTMQLSAEGHYGLYGCGGTFSK